MLAFRRLFHVAAIRKRRIVAGITLLGLLVGPATSAEAELIIGLTTQNSLISLALSNFKCSAFLGEDFAGGLISEAFPGTFVK